MTVAYLLITAAGVSAFTTPSPALSKQGGGTIVVVWAVLCTLGGLAGLVGIALRRDVVDVTGAYVCSTACLVWGAAIVLQAFTSDTASSITAACVAFAMTALFARRATDMRQAS
jgi:hypothetical protein